MVVGDKPPKGEKETTTIEEMPLPTGEPIVALFDGVPLANHRLLGFSRGTGAVNLHE